MRFILVVFILTPLFITFVASFAHALNEPEESMILYFSFDSLDDDQALDHSKYKNNGEIKGTPEHVEGKFDKALEFNGTTDWVEIPHHESLTVDQDVTVMAWIWTERHTGPNNERWQGILAKSNSPRSYSFYTESPSKCLHFVSGGGSVCNDGEVKLNEWQHVAAQLDNGTHRYWINGVNAGTSGNKSKPPGNADTSPVFIGTTAEGAGRLFLGLIDEVRIWNRALSEDEIVEQMNQGHFELFPVDPRQKLTTTWGTIKTKER